MSEVQPQIIFITGTSASGKTTLYESFREDPDFENIEFHDIDEGGTPPIGRESWREYRVADLLFGAMERLKEGRSTIICGITKPHEVFELEHFDPGLWVSFILLEISDDQISERINARIEKEISAGRWNESIASASRMIDRNFELKKILHNSVSVLRRGYIIDASELTKSALHDQAKQIIVKGDGCE